MANHLLEKADLPWKAGNQVRNSSVRAPAMEKKVWRKRISCQSHLEARRGPRAVGAVLVADKNKLTNRLWTCWSYHYWSALGSGKPTVCSLVRAWSKRKLCNRPQVETTRGSPFHPLNQEFWVRSIATPPCQGWSSSLASTVDPSHHVSYCSVGSITGILL